MYKLSKMTPISQLTTKDLKGLNMACDIAQKSPFASSKRLGACLKGKGSCFLCGRKSA